MTTNGTYRAVVSRAVHTWAWLRAALCVGAALCLVGVFVAYEMAASIHDLSALAWLVYGCPAFAAVGVILLLASFAVPETPPSAIRRNTRNLRHDRRVALK
jgi:hypothetical protein